MIIRSTNKPTTGTHRRGFGLVELTITVVMLMAAMAVTVQMIGMVATERRSVARRERAILEAANLLERFSARHWNDLTTDKAKSLVLSEPTLAALPKARLDVAVADGDAEPRAKRITVTITWVGRSGQSETPARLVGWVYRHRGDQ